MLLPYLVDWNSDLILRHAWAELLVPGDGFHIPAGILHAPGTALTFEVQENSDVFAMLQAKVAGKIIPKDLLFKDVTKEDRKKYGEAIVLDQVNWELSGDRFFYENRHLGQKLVQETKQKGGEEYWIFYNTTKFSGKRTLVKPGQKFTATEPGAYSVLVWRGSGTFDGLPIKGGEFGLDELLVTHGRATKPHDIVNDGKETLELFRFFGPDIHPECPRIPKYPAK
jgi:mannose-6-phosphate isomerase class I